MVGRLWVMTSSSEVAAAFLPAGLTRLALTVSVPSSSAARSVFGTDTDQLPLAATVDW